MLVQKAEPTSTRNTRWTDMIAGLSIAGLLLPEAVAYSNIANLPLQTGVIALFAGLLCYGLFGTSRFAIVSATSSSAVILAAVSASLAHGDSALRMSLAIGLVIVTGLFFSDCRSRTPRQHFQFHRQACVTRICIWTRDCHHC